MLKATIRNIKAGKFKQLETIPHKRFRLILEQNNIEYKEEEIVQYYSFDFYLPKYKLYIEVDGDYFHSNPKVFPDGPKTKTQKRNFANDKRKNSFVKTKKIDLVRFWEYDILNNPEEVECKLKKLLV